MIGHWVLALRDVEKETALADMVVPSCIGEREGAGCGLSAACMCLVCVKTVNHGQQYCGDVAKQ